MTKIMKTTKKQLIVKLYKYHVKHGNKRGIKSKIARTLETTRQYVYAVLKENSTKSKEL
jgi:DNA invertase Pin-like site-specific DNA recombinase